MRAAKSANLIFPTFVVGVSRGGETVALEEQEIVKIKELLLENFDPEKIILFGSRAKGNVRTGSDYDICVIAPYRNKSETLVEMYSVLDHTVPIDIVLYKPEEWEKWVDNSESFVSIIQREGKVIYGR